MKATVLIIDDDPALRRALADRLAFWGHEADAVADGTAGLASAAARGYDLILLDLTMPGPSGLDVLAELKRRNIDSDVIVLTAHGTVEAAVAAIRLGAADFLQKPADFELLEAAIVRLLDRRRLLHANRALVERREEETGAVLGESRQMRAIQETIHQVAPTSSTVLIMGESGVGKHVVAESIHRESPRAGGPFVYVNMVALPDELAESILFGHEKGAFTGAVARKDGKLEAAAGGTIFLDEIGDITPALQTKLLHFLETMEFERVGGTRTLRVDARVIAATNRNLEQAIQRGAFRSDLYYRLNVIRIEVPPLRERREDIPILTARFLERHGRKVGRWPLRLDPRVAEIFQSFEWPGNVRQLNNCVERIVVLARTDTLTPDLLPPELFVDSGAEPRDLEALPLKDALTEYKRRHIRDALARAGGNQTRAAELLGLQRTHLNRLLKELGIDSARSGPTVTPQ